MFVIMPLLAKYSHIDKTIRHKKFSQSTNKKRQLAPHKKSQDIDINRYSLVDLSSN